MRGDAETGTKNWELRRVPVIPDARTLFERMRSERPGEPLEPKSFAWLNARSLLIAPAKRPAQIASRIMI